MRRAAWWRRVVGSVLVVAWGMALAVLPALAQQGPINPRIPPPPPPPEQPAPPPPAPRPAPPPAAQPSSPPKAAEPAPPPPSLPASVAIPAGTRIVVVLDTPVSTRISKPGQLVTFRTSDPLRLDEQLELPPETSFTGGVVQVKRPGAFGKAGVLRVKVDRINLSSGATKEVAARVDSPDLQGSRASSDSHRSTDLYNLAVYTIEGTLLGAQIHGGKGAAVGAGAGAALAVLIMMSRRGADVYLEPGMPFVVVLDRAVELPGAEVYAAQQSYAREHGSGGTASTSSSADASQPERDADGTPVDPGRPRLKRRPKPAQP